MLIPNWLSIIIIIAVFAAVMVYLEFLRSKYVLSITRKAVTISGLPRALEGMKFAVVGDLHSMSFGEKNAELARKIKREKPDYILFTGNMGDAKTVQVDAFYDFLDSVGRDIPIVMVPGRDDLRLGKGTVHKNFVKSVTEAGGVILNNSRAEINVGGEKIYIYGFCPELKKDESKSPSEWKFRKVRTEDVSNALGTCPKDATVILMTNYAKGFESYSRWGATLVLAGGTHGGHYRIPFIDKIVRNKAFSYTSGEYQLARSKMYVNRGLSSSQRKRFNNPPEIAILSIARPNSPLLRTMPINNESASEVFYYWFKSESRAICELLNERTDAIRDWWATVTNKEQSVYAKRGSAKKDSYTYLSPQERAKENAKRMLNSSDNKPVRRVSRVQTRSEYISELQSEFNASETVHSYDKFKTVEEIENIKVFGNIHI